MKPLKRLPDFRSEPDLNGSKEPYSGGDGDIPQGHEPGKKVYYYLEGIFLPGYG
jgi:hypothetical protein